MPWSLRNWFTGSTLPSVQPEHASETGRAGIPLAPGPPGNVQTRAQPWSIGRPGLEAGAGRSRWAGVTPASAPDPANASLLQRARHMVQNSAPCAAAVAAWSARCVGAGIMPTPQPPDPDDAARITDAFAEWADRADFDAIGDLYALQVRMFNGMFVDGNSLVELVLDGDELRLRTRPIDQLAVTMNRNLTGSGGYIQNGIDYTADGRVRGFHLYTNSLTFQTSFVPADQLLHIYRALTPGQQFGVSSLAPILLLARENDLLHDALVTNAKVQSLHCGFIVDLNSTGGIPYTEGTQAGSLFNAGLIPGSMYVLGNGQDVKWSTPQQANSAIDLMKITLQQIAAGTGTPSHLIDFNMAAVNFSAAKASLLDFKRRCEQVVYLTLIPLMLAPIYKRWLALEIATGRLDISDTRANYKCDWLMPSFEMLDGEKDINAEIMAINAGIKTRTQSVSERGWDIRQLDLQLQQERQRAEQLGLVFSNLQPTGNPNG